MTSNYINSTSSTFVENQHVRLSYHNTFQHFKLFFETRINRQINDSDEIAYGLNIFFFFYQNNICSTSKQKSKRFDRHFPILVVYWLFTKSQQVYLLYANIDHSVFFCNERFIKWLLLFVCDSIGECASNVLIWIHIYFSKDKLCR